VFGTPFLSLIYALYLAVLGAVLASLEGLLFSFALNISRRGVWKNAVLGALGMVGGFLACALVPWPYNTITYKVGDTVVTSTMSRFQHPYYIGFALALSFPLVRAIAQKRAHAPHIRDDE